MIDKVQRLTIPEIKDRYLADACIGESDFDRYYCGKSCGHVISLTGVRKYQVAACLDEMKNIGFYAPQSYLYPSRDIINYIESKKCM